MRTDINKNLRTSLGAMVVMDVHNRDTTEELAALKVECSHFLMSVFIVCSKQTSFVAGCAPREYAVLNTPFGVETVPDSEGEEQLRTVSLSGCM